LNVVDKKITTEEIVQFPMDVSDSFGDTGKIVTIIWHLLKNNEYYDDPLFPRKKVQTMNKVMVPKEVSLEQLLEIIAKADILIKAPDPDIL